MNEYTDCETARSIMGNDFIGISDICTIKNMKLDVEKIPQEIPYSIKTINEKKGDYILLPGVSRFTDGKFVTIRNMVRLFGKDPTIFEPCFYNQDWYEKESFIDVPMKDEWYFIRKNVYEDSRGVQPQELLEKYLFPTAISCVYAFFVVWLIIDKKLWYHDFVWCSDKDHNGDRIYVGKYNDIDGINKDGFNIHRHLSIKNNYACIDK